MEKMFSDEELGVKKFMKKKTSPEIKKPAIDTTVMPQDRLYGQHMQKERMHAKTPWKPKGRR